MEQFVFISEIKKVNHPPPPETCCCSQFPVISKLELICRIVVLFYHVTGKQSQMVNHKGIVFSKGKLFAESKGGKEAEGV